MNEIKAQHAEIEITYNEKQNLWKFELRGRERSADSLAKAKEIIDTPVKVDKPTFTRVKAYTERAFGNAGFQIVDVTSVAETHGWQETEYWICTAKKNRQKIARYNLYPVNDKNAELVTKIMSIDDQLTQLRKNRDSLEKKLEQMPTQK